MAYELINGDCLKILEKMEDNSVDAIVTDPPYGIEFMAKKWDYDVPSVEIWKECIRVLKHGGHLLSFAGSRTYHRMAVNIEDAGFEIRDQIMWVYGSVFPKSLNIGHKAEEWGGWGSALKPAHEPIVVARKPLIGTIVENVLEHGTGGLNIDACRIETDENPSGKRRKGKPPIREGGVWNNDRRSAESFSQKREGENIGRFPANFIHDGSDEVVSLFPEGKARFFYCAKASKQERDRGLHDFEESKSRKWRNDTGMKYTGSGNLREEMSKNFHPTVKPVDLMKYLCRLITPPNGVVLDPFMGSGTTCIGATTQGFGFIGIEREEGYIEIARERITHWVDEQEEILHEKRAQRSLSEWFGE